MATLNPHRSTMGDTITVPAILPANCWDRSAVHAFTCLESGRGRTHSRGHDGSLLCWQRIAALTIRLTKYGEELGQNLEIGERRRVTERLSVAYLALDVPLGGDSQTVNHHAGRHDDDAVHQVRRQLPEGSLVGLQSTHRGRLRSSRSV